MARAPKNKMLARWKWAKKRGQFTREEFQEAYNCNRRCAIEATLAMRRAGCIRKIAERIEYKEVDCLNRNGKKYKQLRKFVYPVFEATDKRPPESMAGLHPNSLKNLPKGTKHWRKHLAAAWRAKGLPVPSAVEFSSTEDSESVVQERRDTTSREIRIPSLGELFSQL